MNIHRGDIDRSSEIVRQRKRYPGTQIDAPRHMEETHVDPWILLEMLRKRLLGHQT